MEMRNKTLSRLLLLAVLFVIVWVNSHGERVAINGGIGWDGMIYRDIVCHLEEKYFTGGFNSYHMHRVLPFVIIHYIMKWTGLAMTDANILQVAMWLNIVTLSMTVLCFYRLSHLFRWKGATEAMAFASVFFTYPVLKYMGYYPLLTDTMALFLSFLAACCYFDRGLKHRFLWLTLVGIISMTVWPVLSLIVLLLVALPSSESEATCSDRPDDSSDFMTLALRWTYVLWVPLVFAAYVWYRMCYRGVDTFNAIFVGRPVSFLWLLPVAIVAWMAVVWRATGMLQIPVKRLLCVLLERKNLLRLIVCCVAFVLFYKAIEYFGGPSVFSLPNELASMCQLPLTDVLIFIESPFAYLGCFFVAVVCYWREICQEAHRNGVAVLAVLALALLFLADIGTRKLTAFYPFMLILLMNVINRRSLPKWMPIVVIVLQLALSCFWLQINVEGIEEAFLTYSIAEYMQFPAQRYFMFHGPWQSHQIYLIYLTIELVLLSALFLLKRHDKTHSLREE